MDIEDRVAQAMRQLESNIEKASRNPEAVLQGSFSSTSGNVTVWVDSLGRTERYWIAANSVFEGDEPRLLEAFTEATREARRKAENLEFTDEAEGHQEQLGDQQSDRSMEEDCADGAPTTWMQ